MNVTSVRYNLAVSTYSLVRRSGFLETVVGERLFSSAYFLYKRYLDNSLYRLLVAYPGLCRGGNCLDVGANIGYTASVLARATDSGRKVFAFEPEPFNYHLLRRLSSDNEFKDKIMAWQFAVGAEEGTIDLWRNDGHHADHRVITDEFRSSHPGATGTSVPLVSIDRFLEDHPGPVSFIKVDVQGYELPVCLGMKITLEKNPNLTIVLEYMPSAISGLGFDPAALISFLRDHGLKLYTLQENGDLLPGIPPRLEDTEYVDLLCSRRSLECCRT